MKQHLFKKVYQISVKTSESLWNQTHDPFSPPLAQLSMMEVLLWLGVFTKLSLSLQPVLKGYCVSLAEAGHQHVSASF